MPYIKTRDGTDIYVKDWGDGRPVILIHGWPVSADMWDAQSMALADAGFRAIAYDRRGFGRSGQPWSGYDYDTLADDLADVMEATGATEDVTLVGFSMGGGEVARYMSRHDGKGVVAAALISSVVPYMLKTDDNPHGVPQETFNQITKGLTTDRAHFYRQTFLPQFLGVGYITSPVSDEILDITTSIAMMAGFKPTLACADSFAHTDFRPDLASFRVPTLIVHGTKDQTVPIDATGRAAAKGIAGAQLVEYDGEPHGLVITSSDRLTQDLLTFLGDPRERSFVAAKTSSDALIA
ncbi:alpha/beta fold hydrolase [Sphingomonas japonica]|uniref:Pimeloyl-ACP methyl ester carboxylesterase n=1 Tax=Sphingomonas japonica TaxID=511662 RepID=A0ABX0U5N8_9SPHN|nr:alpha/beta hydrolase [Sphingomonas japonica]NIJ25174.1 pimeloyl-ACP methyl ester carboxylesterase [Sphingomonas japonica]